METTLYDQLSKFSDLGVSVNLIQLIICLALSLTLSIIVAKVYQISFRGASYSPAFMHTLVICGVVVGVIMLIIGSNVARAFSLVGALSIVRFRNAVKDPRDVAFVFLSMAVGMACGTGFYLIALVFTLFISSAILILSKIKFGESGLEERILRIKSPAIGDVEHLFDNILQAFTDNFSILSISQTKMGTEMELVFSLTVSRSFNAQKLIAELSKVNNQLRIQIAGTNHIFDL